MSVARLTSLAAWLLAASACPNPASRPVKVPDPPPPEGDTAETAPARRFERLLALEEKGRLPRAQRPWLASALRLRAREYEAMGAPAAALADLARAHAMAPLTADPALHPRWKQLHRALGDRALALGNHILARELHQKAYPATDGARPLAPWRRACLEPEEASTEAIGAAIVRLHLDGPEQAARLLRVYLFKGGVDPQVLGAGLASARESPDPRLAQQAFKALLALQGARHRILACDLFGRDVGDPACTPDLETATGAPSECDAPCLLSLGLLPAALANASVSERQRVEAAHLAMGSTLARWGVVPPSANTPWPLSLEQDPGPVSVQVPSASWAMVTRAALEERTRDNVAHRALWAALQGNQSEALKLAQGASQGQVDRLRLLARIQALGGQRQAAAKTLIHLRERSPGGVTWLLAVLEDLAVLGLREDALNLATSLVEALPTDPVILRTLALVFVHLDEPERCHLMVERWAASAGDPAQAYLFAMDNWARRGNARLTAHWAARLLEWTGGRPGPTLRFVATALQTVGRHRDAAAILALNPVPAPAGASSHHPGGAPPSGDDSPWPPNSRARVLIPADPLATACRAARGGRLEEALVLLATLASGAEPARRGMLTLLAASLVDGAGHPRRARRILADAWQGDPHRYGAAAYQRLATAARGRRLSLSLLWDRIPFERTHPCHP